MKHLFLFSIVFAIIGCQSAPAKPAAASNKAKDELAAKLKTMTPAERAEYFKKNPDEVKNALSFGGGVPAPPGR